MPGKKQPSKAVYDSVGEIIRTVDQLGQATTFGFAAVIGRNTSVTDADGNTTSYTYTTAGRRASVTNPMGGRTTFTYDNRGNLATVVSPRGNVKGADRAAPLPR